MFDPGVLELMAEKLDTDIKEIVRILNKESGLLGLYDKGVKEMYVIRQAALEGDKEAELVVEIAAYRVAKYFCSYLGTMEKSEGHCFHRRNRRERGLLPRKGSGLYETLQLGDKQRSQLNPE